MTAPKRHYQPLPGLDCLANLVDVQEAADYTGLSTRTIREAIRRGDLPAFIPRGRDPRRTGRGQGWRIGQKDLDFWYFGTLGWRIWEAAQKLERG